MKIQALAILMTLVQVTAAPAETASVQWPSRDSNVVCGGSADGEEMNVRVVLENELLAAESKNERLLIYIDLHKAGQARIVMAEGMTDADYEKREAALGKLDADEVAVLRKLTAGRTSDFYVGFAEGYVHFETASGGRSLSLSCQEIKN